MSSKIVRVGDLTHVTYLEKGEKVYVRSFHENTREWSKPVLIGQGFDNHAAPTMAADSEGYLHLIHGPHHGEFQYRVSVRPNDASEWGKETRFGSYGTYASLVIDRKDQMHVVYRGGPTRNRMLMYQTKHARVTQWSFPRQLVDGNPSYMISYDSSIALGPDDTLHVAFNFYSSVYQGTDSGRRIGYLKSSDGGSTWTDSSGKARDLPVKFATTEVVLDDTQSRLRLSNLSVNSRGEVFFSVNRLKDTPKRSSILKLVPGSKPVEHNLNELIDSSKYELDVYPQTTIDSLDRIWVAAPIVNRGETWGGPSTGLAIFRIPSEFTKSQLERVALIPPRQRRDASGKVTGADGAWLPSWESFTGHNRLSEYPRMLYTLGFGNTSHSLGTALPTRVVFREFRPDPKAGQ